MPLPKRNRRLTWISGGDRYSGSFRKQNNRAHIRYFKPKALAEQGCIHASQEPKLAKNKIVNQDDTKTAGIVSAPTFLSRAAIADAGDAIIGKPLQWVFYTQQEGGEESWGEVSARDTDARIQAKQPMFATVCATALDGDTRLHVSDLVYLDWDAADINESISAVKRFVYKLKKLSVDPESCRWFATGGRGFHCEMPLALFKSGGVADLTRAVIENLPRIMKAVVSDAALFVDTLDQRVYTGGKGRQWRQPNVQRPNGKYKVACSVDELRTMTPDMYDTLTASPRDLIMPVAAEYCPALGDLWARKSAEVLASQAINKARKRAVVDPGDPKEMRRVETALGKLDADDYQTWYQSGMAIQADLGEAGFDLWDSWSSTGAKYKRDECRKLWDESFIDLGGQGVRLGTVFMWAKAAGWIDPHPECNPLTDPKQNPDARPKLTELGMAEFIAAKYSSMLRYVEDAGCWIVWDGKQWNFEPDGASINPLLKTESRGLLRHITPDTGEDAAKALMAFATRMEKASTVRAVKELMRAESDVRVGSGLLDSHPYLLNVDNGVLDLKTGRLLAHDPELLLTQRAHVSFDAGAQCPRWLQFVDEIACGDRELVRYLQCMAGYCLSGDISRHASFFMHGAGGNGKSVLMGTLRRLMGSYAATLPIDALMVRHRPGQASPDLAQLRGVRLAITSEIARGQQLNSGVFKDLVSGDAMSVRFLNQNPTMLRPVCKIVMPGNFLPTISENDQGTWRRVQVVPFVATFTGSGRDFRLEEKLVVEMGGILNWCLEGFQAAQRDEMRLPTAVEKKTAEYRASLDTVQRFVDECMIQDDIGREDGGRVRASDLYLIFQDWCRRNGYACPNGRVFGEDMADKVPKVRSGGLVSYRGWRVWSETVPDVVNARWSDRDRDLATETAETEN